MLENHLEKLKPFYLTAQEKSLLKASEVLGLTQPAITKSIRLLEEQLGSELFLRHRRGVELTKAGRLLQEFCDSLFLKIRDVEKRIQDDKELAGIIKIGTYETLGELFWPKALRTINKQYPDLTVELTTQNSGDMLSKLASGGIDLIVDAEPKTADHLFSKILYTDKFGIFCKKGSRFLSKEGVIPFSYVARASDKNQIPIDQHLRKRGIPFELAYDVESFTMVRSFILEDICVGVLPLKMATKYLNQDQMQKYGHGDYFGEHRVCATSLYSRRKEPRIELLIKLLQSFV